MQLSLGLVLIAVPIYLENDDDDFFDDDYEKLPPQEITFYDISAHYPTVDPIYGKGTIIISDSLEYFTKTSQSKIYEAIQYIKQQELVSLFYKN